MPGKLTGTQLVLASGNAGKLKEFQGLFAGQGIDVIPQSDFNVPEADETGLSFVENAIIKARHACTCTGLPALADDSGLEVDFLNGAPGIYSSRFAGPAASDQDNNEKLLQLMAAVPAPQRSARFQCVLVLMQHPKDPTPLICQGSWEGRILEKPCGAEGFGYDPIFYASDAACAAAELSKDDKNRISHRARALAQLLSRLQHAQNQQP